MKVSALVLALALASSTLLAASAPWYQWRHKANGELYCTQVSPGEGWALSDGPFRDAGCQEKGRPGQPRPR